MRIYIKTNFKLKFDNRAAIKPHGTWGDKDWAGVNTCGPLGLFLFRGMFESQSPDPPGNAAKELLQFFDELDAAAEPPGEDRQQEPPPDAADNGCEQDDSGMQEGHESDDNFSSYSSYSGADLLVWSSASEAGGSDYRHSPPESEGEPTGSGSDSSNADDSSTSRDDDDDGHHHDVGRAFYGRRPPQIVALYSGGKISLMANGVLEARCGCPGHGQNCTIRRRFIYKRELSKPYGKCIGLLAAWLDKGHELPGRREHHRETNWPELLERRAARHKARQAASAGNEALRLLFDQERQLGCGASDSEPDIPFPCKRAHSG